VSKVGLAALRKAGVTLSADSHKIIETLPVNAPDTVIGMGVTSDRCSILYTLYS
jgi:hypothetical protein